jgi:surface-anchored protein
MRTIVALSTAALLASTASATEFITADHADVAFGFDLVDGWEPHIHLDDAVPPEPNEFEPHEAVFVGRFPFAQKTVPAAAAFGFLGSAGSNFYALPQTEDPNLPYIGIDTEEVAPGALTNNAISLRLLSKTGPGDFFWFQEDSFGTPTIGMNSTNLALAPLQLSAGNHVHGTWAFTQSGLYELTFEVSGIPTGATAPVTAEATYSFLLVPEPTTIAAGAAGALLTLARRRRN